jgi:acetylornithine deacetylase/succinyl-diaminopimelate desuccinylase-like protein
LTTPGGVTTDGGKTWALNVIPIEAEAGFDVRIPPTVPLDEFEAKMKEWYRLLFSSASLLCLRGLVHCTKPPNALGRH